MAYIIGFSAQSVVSLNAIVAAFERAPAAHRKGIRVVRYAPEGLTGFGLNGPGARYSAIYCEDLDAILVRQFSSPSDFEDTLLHEIGHHVFRHVLSIDQRFHWVTRLFPGSACVSRYARRNASEDFAESYMCHLLHPDILRRIELKNAFMRDVVFGEANIGREAKREA
jgi:hypothetical protein